MLLTAIPLNLRKRNQAIPPRLIYTVNRSDHKEALA